MRDTRSALIIANYQYDDASLRQLLAPGEDAEALARVLGDPAIGAFQVRTFINQPSHKVSLEIESCFSYISQVMGLRTPTDSCILPPSIRSWSSTMCGGPRLSGRTS
jgi:hypothetical protein